MHERPIPPLLALLAALLLVSGCGKDRPDAAPPAHEPGSTKLPTVVEKTPKGDTEKTPVEPPKTDRPAFTVTAIGITEEFAKNAASAEKKYAGKLIEVEGTVKSVKQNSVQRNASLYLVGYAKAGEPLAREVNCEIKKALVGPVGLLGKGQKVRIKGKFASASGGNVTLTDAEYEELTPSSVPRRTADALAKEFAQDTNEAVKKYVDKEVIVEGTIADLIDKAGDHSVKLAVSGKIPVSCTLDEDEFKTLKKGDKVKIKGEVDRLPSGEVVILSAYLVNR
jgi:hypothetical protein